MPRLVQGAEAGDITCRLERDSADSRHIFKSFSTRYSFSLMGNLENGSKIQLCVMTAHSPLSQGVRTGPRGG